MQQESEHAPEFRDQDTRVWTNFGQLASRWEQTNGLNRSEMLNMLLQGFLCGEMWPTVLPNLYGGVGDHGPKFTASPVRPHWMKGKRRFPTETFTRLDFLRAARNHLDVDSRDSPFAAGYRGLIGIPVDQYDPPFIETYIEKLTPSPNAVVRWCSNHGWPMPPGLSYSETDVAAVDQEEHAGSQKHRADDPNEGMGDTRPDQQRKTARKNPRGAGRKKGSGSFEKEDKQLLEKMKPRVTAGAAPWDAALAVVGDAPGKGTDESRAKRLLARYKEQERKNSV